MSVIPLESAIVKRITRRLEREPTIWQFNVHGGAYGRAGIPDIVGCIDGQLFALEVKRPVVGRVDPLQTYEIRKIQAAGGWAAVVTSVEEAEAALGL